MNNIKKIILSLLFICSYTLLAQPLGWSVYLSYHDNSYNLEAGKHIYSLCEGNLFSYSPEDGEVRFFSKLNGLSAKHIEKMGYSSRYKCLVLVYDNGNIDLLYDNGDVVNLSDYAKSSEKSKKINDLTVNENWALLTTSSGLLVIDLSKKEIKGFYHLNTNIATGEIVGNRIFVIMNDHCMVCPVYANPADIKQWKVVSQVGATILRYFGGKIWCFSHSGAWTFDEKSSFPTELTRTIDFDADQVSVGQNAMVIANAKEIACFGVSNVKEPTKRFVRPQEWKWVSPSSKGYLWVSEGNEGLQAYTYIGGHWEKKGSSIGGYGPLKDMCYYMHYDDNKLLIGGGFLDYSGKEHPPVAMIYEHGKWHFLKTKGVAKETGVPFRNVTSLVEDPRQKDHYFVSATTGLYEYKNFQLLKFYSTTNSPLRSAASDGNRGYVYIDGLVYDKQYNLWMVNNQVDSLIKVLRPNGTWVSFCPEEIKKAPTLEKTLIDAKGRFWATSRRTVDYHTSGVLCYDTNGTLTDRSDDKYKYRSVAYNEDGRSVSIGGSFSGVYAMEKDLNGHIWIGAGTGVFVVENPDDWFSNNFRISQPKVPRNDGTNFADYLLDAVPVSAIAVDGANQKWLGTYGSGVYLVNEDGTSVLEHFTAENSPLLSNNIYSISINPESGEVMFGTDVGLCSYQGKVTESKAHLSKNAIKVFPNPVTPQYNGVVTITGLTANAEVRITTVNGDLVSTGRSKGGTYTWDIREFGRRRVGAGVYFIMIATSEGNKGIVAKVVVI